MCVLTECSKPCSEETPLSFLEKDMQGHYAESQQSEERLEEEGSVSRSSRETGPAAASDYGAHSPVGSSRTACCMLDGVSC